MSYYVYIITNNSKTVFYTGVTGNIVQRMYQHKNKLVEGFSKKYNLTILVYLNKYDYILDAIQDEKRIKRWKRKWKIELINETNPNWKDLSLDFIENH